MESWIPCVGCGEPLFGLPCRWCTCERCGNDIQNGSCLFCGSSNSFAYNPNPNSFNEPPNFSEYPPQPQPSPINQQNCFDCGGPSGNDSFCEWCGGCPHPEYDCRTGDMLVYEHNPYNNQTSSGLDTSSYYTPPQQFYCCEYCGGPHFNSDCQTGNPLVYEHGPCNNYDYSYHDQPPQYQMMQTQPQPSPQDSAFEDLFRKLDDMRNELENLAVRHTQNDHHGESMEELLAIERAAHNRFLFNQACMLDDDDDDEESTIPLSDIISQLPQSIAITSFFPTLNPEDSRIMGDEPLSTIPEKESDEFIKSSVENLVSIPSKSEDISGSECDSSICSDHPLDTTDDFFGTFSNPLFNSNDDLSSSDEESLSDEDIPNESLKVYSNSLFEFDDEYFSIKNPLFDGELENDEVKDSITHKLDDMTSVLIPDILPSPTYVTLPFEDRHYIDFTYVVRVFLPFFSYKVDCPLILSFGSEDKVFDPGIPIYHSLEPDVSHRSGTFKYFKCLSKHLE